MKILFFILSLFSASNLLAEAEVTGNELIKSKFSLTTDQNKDVTEKDYYGKYTFVFFGFSNCATICPAGLSAMVAATNKLDLGDKLVPLFITVDPERDTVERLADYVKIYDPKLVGLTGDPKEIERVAKSFRAYYGKSDVDSDGNYSFDHSPIIYLIGKNGEYLTHFSSTIGPEEIAIQAKNYIK